MPAMAFADGRRVSTGVGGKQGVRNSPTVLNAAYATLQFWDGRAGSLEKQSEGPVTNPGRNGALAAWSSPAVGARSNLRCPIRGGLWSRPDHICEGREVHCLVRANCAQRQLSLRSLLLWRRQVGHDGSADPWAAIVSRSQEGQLRNLPYHRRDYALFTDNKFHNIGVGFSAMTRPTIKGGPPFPATPRRPARFALPRCATSRSPLLTCTMAA